MERGLARPGKQYNLNTTATTLYVAGVCIACWVIYYLASVGFPFLPEISQTPLWQAVAGMWTNRESAYTVGLLLVFGLAYLLLRTNYVLMLIRERTVLPFLFYLLYAGVNPLFVPLNPATAGVFCLLAGIYLLFLSYHDEGAVGNAYKAALFFGIGSLCWIHILCFLPLFWRGMYNFKTWSYKIAAASLFGIVTVYWFVLGWCVWTDDYTLFTHSFAQLFRFNLFWIHDLGWIDWVSVLLMALATVTAIIHLLAHELEDNLRTRQFLWFFILLATWTLVLIVVYAQSKEELLQILCLPAAVLSAHFFTLVRNKYTFGLFHLMVAAMAGLLFVRLWNF